MVGSDAGTSGGRATGSVVSATRAHVGIDPTREVPLGCGKNTGGDWSVADPIEINMLGLWDETGAPTILISCDLLYPGSVLDQLVDGAFPGVPRERVLLGASHTHAAPMADPDKPALGEIDLEYMALLKEKFGSAARALMDESRRVPVEVRAGSGEADHAVNRRLHRRIRFGKRPWFNRIVFAPNPQGPRDQTVTTLSLVGPDGSVFAVVWNYACHPVDYPTPKTVSAHFPGSVRAAIRRRWGRDVSVLYFQGFSGDTRPRYRTRRTLEATVRRVLQGGAFLSPDVRSYEEWTEGVAADVLKVVEKSEQIDVSKTTAARDVIPGSAVARPLESGISFQALRLGDDLTLVAASAEVVSEYALRLRETSPTGYLMCVGCTDVTFGYVPTKRMLQEGGYEAQEYLPHFGLEALSPNVEHVFRSGLEGVLDAASSRDGAA